MNNMRTKVNNGTKKSDILKIKKLLKIIHNKHNKNQNLN